MTKKEILEMTGLSEEEFYRQYPTEESFQMAMEGMVDEYKKGGWIQKATASIKRRGTEGVCTGSKFGGPSCRPGTRRYALAKTFRKMAKARKKEDGGMVEMYEDYITGEYGEPEMQYAQGGVVDVYQLMGMPTPSMYGMGGIASIVPDSRVISRQNFPNMGMAMGGGVNGPNLLQVDTGNMPKFAMGAEPQEKEMTLKEKYQAYLGAKPVAKYTNFPRHPKVGIDPRGTVTGTVDEQGNPVQINTEGSEANWKLGNGDNFITVANDGGKISTKKALAFYNNHDNIALAALMHNTAERKAKKEAAEEQAAMSAYDKFTAKYGGTIKRMYARGGMINRYDKGAGVTGPRVAPFFNFPDYQGTYPDQSPYMAEGNESWGPLAGMTNPVTGMANYLNKLSPAQATPMMGRLPLKGNPQPNLTATPEYRYFNNPGSMNIVGDTTDYFDQGNVPGALELMQQQNTMSPSKFNQMARTSGSSNFDFSSQPTEGKSPINSSNFMSNIIPYGVAASQVIEPLLQKPYKMNPEKYMVKSKLQSYETPYETDYGPYNVTKYNLRQLGNAGPAGFTALYNAFASQEAKNRLANRETNLQRKMAADQFNIGLEGTNKQIAMQGDMFNEQNRAARRNAIRQGVMNVAGTYYNQDASTMTKQGLSAEYSDYEFPWNKKRNKSS